MAMVTKMLVSEGAICAKYIWSSSNVEKSAHKQADPRKEMLMIRKSIWILGVALLFVGALIVLQPAAMAEDLSMVLAAPPPGNYMYDVYLSPYYAYIGGATTETPIICDDFEDETYSNEGWTASVTNGLADSGTQMAKENPTVTGSQLNTDYDAIAWLASQLLQPDLTLYQQALMSFAVWDIFDNSGVEAWVTPYKSTDTNYGVVGKDPSYLEIYTEAQTALTSATPGERSILTIYSAVPGSGLDGTTPQEFVVVTPEASAPVILAFNLLALFGVFSVVRRRVLRNAGVPR